MAYSEEVVSASILEKASRDAEGLDWLSIPSDLRIIGDDLLEAFCDVPRLDFLGGLDEQENEKPKDSGEPSEKRLKVGDSSGRFVALASSPELVKCSEGFVPENTKAS